LIGDHAANGSDAAKMSAGSRQADAGPLLSNHGAEANRGRARARERDVILTDAHAGRTPAQWRQVALIVARMTGKRVGLEGCCSFIAARSPVAGRAAVRLYCARSIERRRLLRSERDLRWPRPWLLRGNIPLPASRLERGVEFVAGIAFGDSQNNRGAFDRALVEMACHNCPANTQPRTVLD
jgi:hypothetical protein